MESTYLWPRAGRRRFGGGFGRSLDSQRWNFVWNIEYVSIPYYSTYIGGDISAFCRTRFSPLGQNGEPSRMGRSPAKVNFDWDRMVLTTNLVTLKLVLTTNGPLSVGLSGAGTSCKLSFNTRSLQGWEDLAWFQWEKDYISMYIKKSGFLKFFLQVLPGFAGQVPDAFVERYPGASYTKQTWKPFKASNLSGVYMIRWIDVRLSFVVKPIAVPWIQSLSR